MPSEGAPAAEGGPDGAGVPLGPDWHPASAASGQPDAGERRAETSGRPAHRVGYSGRRVMAMTSRASSSCSSVRCPESRYPSSMTTSRIVRPSLRAFFATAAAFS